MRDRQVLGDPVPILYGDPGDARLAPFYDLVCTRAYPRLDRRLAMGVGDQRDPGQVGRADWRSLAEAVGVGPRLVFSEVERLAQDMPRVFAEVAATHVEAHGDTPAIQLVRSVLEKQCRRSLRLLDR